MYAASGVCNNAIGVRHPCSFPSGMTWSGLPVSDAVRRGQHRFVRVRLSLYRANSAAPSALKRCRQCRPGRPQSTLQRRFLVSIDLISSFVVGIIKERRKHMMSISVIIGSRAGRRKASRTRGGRVAAFQSRLSSQGNPDAARNRLPCVQYFPSADPDNEGANQID